MPRSASVRAQPRPTVICMSDSPTMVSHHVFYKRGGILLSDIHKIVLTNLDYFYLRVTSCRALLNHASIALAIARRTSTAGLSPSTRKSVDLALLLISKMLPCSA